MQIEDYNQLRKAAQLALELRCVLEGIHESMDPSELFANDIEMQTVAANVLEDCLDDLLDRATM